MFTHKSTIRVRYADTDQMGYVYYGNYAKYYEIGRVESLRSLGITYKFLEENGIIMPVLENTSKYFLPAFYDDELTILTSVRDKPNTRITFEYEILNQKNVTIHKGKTILVFVDKKSRRPCIIPPIINDVLKPLFDEK